MTPAPWRLVTLKCAPCGTHRNVKTRLVHKDPKRHCACGRQMQVIASTVLTSSEVEV